MEAVRGVLEPSWGTVLRHDLPPWRARARPNARVFFVRKKNNLLRMVVNCRPANQMHQRAPHNSLTTARGVSSLFFLRRVGRLAPNPQSTSRFSSAVETRCPSVPSTTRTSEALLHRSTRHASQCSRWPGARLSSFATRRLTHELESVGFVEHEKIAPTLDIGVVQVLPIVHGACGTPSAICFGQGTVVQAAYNELLGTS